MKRRTAIWALTGLLTLPVLGQAYEPTYQNDQWRQGPDGAEPTYKNDQWRQGPDGPEPTYKNDQ